MGFLKKHWLGILVLASFVLYAVQLPPKFDAKMIAAASLFLFFLGFWLFRGFIRFCGRAWHHGAQTAKRTAR